MYRNVGVEHVNASLGVPRYVQGGRGGRFYCLSGDVRVEVR